MAEDARICVGAVSGARGVKGELRIKPFTDDPKHVGAYGPVETEDGTRALTLTGLKVKGDDVTAWAKEVKTREEAMALKGTRLYVPKARLPEAAEDEFYYADLVGLAVKTKETDELGQVIAVHDFGAGDVLEIRLHEDKRAVMVPFTKACVPKVDVPGGEITIDPPNGLFDRPDPEEEGGKA